MKLQSPDPSSTPRGATATSARPPGRPPSPPTALPCEGARYWRLARRIGKDKAQVALSNTQLTVYHKLLSTPGARYQDLGADYYDKHAQTRRKVRHHLAELDALGYDVTITPRPSPATEDTGQAPAA